MTFKEFLGGDYTPLEHVAIALAIQLVILLLLWPLIGFVGAVAAGTASGAAAFCGREHAQAEKRLVDRGLTLQQATAQALKFWNWDRGSVMDMVCPFMTVLIIGILLFFL